MNPSTWIAIFESAREVGGRLRSKKLGGDAGVVELGRARFNSAESAATFLASGFTLTCNADVLTAAC